LGSLAAVDPRIHWGRALFCAKEAIYKAWYPVQQRWLGFDDVDVRLDADGWFRCRMLAPGADARPFADCSGRWALDEGVLLAAVSLPTTD